MHSLPRMMPTLAPRDLRVVVAALLVAGHLGEGLEPALQGFAPDRFVRVVGVAAGWSASFAAVLAFLALGFSVARGAICERASWSRSLLTGSSAAGAAFALTAVVAGHGAPGTRALLVAVALALVAVRSLAASSFLRVVPIVGVLAGAGAHDLAQRAFEHGGVAFWLAARALATLEALASITLLVALGGRVARERKGVAIVVVAMAALLAGLAARGAATFETTLPALAHRVFVRGSSAVPAFALAGLPTLGPSVARLFAWAAIGFLPASSFGLALLAAFVPSLPGPLAAIAVLLACHLDASRENDTPAP